MKEKATKQDGRTDHQPQEAGARWNELRSLVKQRWSQLTDDDLQQVRGDFEQLCDMIQQRTGQSRQSIEVELQQLVDREPESEGSASLH